MRIGLISQEYPPETAKGGIGTQTLLKAHGLTAMGHHVRVISRSPSTQRSEYRDGGVYVTRIPSTPIPIYTEISDWLSYSQCLAEEIVAQNTQSTFDILDFPEWACEGYAHLLNQSEWNRIPTVLQLHGPLIMLARTLGWPDIDSEFFKVGTQMEATTLRLADAIFSSSACSADWCTREYGLDGNNIPIIHSGVNTSLFRPLPNIELDNPTIIFAGKIVPNKGVEILVEAVLCIKGEFPNLRLRLLGDGEAAFVESLQKKFLDKGLDQMLHMEGYVSREDLPAQLNRGHVFAAPSKYEGGPGFVYLEAMACGLPVVGCRGSGVSEVIRDGDNGYLVTPDNVPELASVLRRLLSDNTQRTAMSERARRFVTGEADSRHCVKRIAEFYQFVIDGTGPNVVRRENAS